MKLVFRIFQYLSFAWKCRIVDFVLAGQNIEVKQAKTPEELEQVFRLRYEVYRNKSYIDPDAYQQEKLTDKYDLFSASFLALRDGAPIGTVRLIKNSEMGFPTEKTFNILDFPVVFLRKEAAELSKLCLKKKFRGGLISFALLKIALEYSKSEGITQWILFTTKRLAHYYEKYLGLTLYLLPTGSLEDYHMEEREIACGKYFRTFDLYPYLVEISKI